MNRINHKVSQLKAKTKDTKRKISDTISSSETISDKKKTRKEYKTDQEKCSATDAKSLSTKYSKSCESKSQASKEWKAEASSNSKDLLAKAMKDKKEQKQKTDIVLEEFALKAPVAPIPKTIC